MSANGTAVVPVRDFFDLVKSIGESKSKQEEDRIITEEVVYLKKNIHQPGVTKKKLKEMVVRSIYVEMLGQDASFAYIKAVELCASTSITQKRAGYLAASLFLSPSHEFRFMLVNQIQRDMKSANILEVTAALVAVCKIITEDMIPAVITDVVNLLNHDSELVRKKVISALHRFYQMDKRVVLDHVDKIRRALCDRDPCVMGATLPLFQAMVVDDVMQFKDLVPSFVSILKQITEHRLPREFDYHRIPAPWIQMHLVRILAILGRGDQVSSEGMYEVFVDVMRRADTGINVGYAMVYETVRAITVIYPNAVLLDAAATSISRFIRSESHNLKYIGIKGLASIVKDHPKYAADHQMAVIDCLEDPDETLKHKTLELLFRMTNAVNVEFIVDKLLSFLATSTDDHFRSDLVNQISQCAERFAPSNSWYVQTIIKVFELAGDKVKSTVAQTLTQLIAEGAGGEEDQNDDEIRLLAVEQFLILFNKPKNPLTLSQTMAWVLGEYGYLSHSHSKEEIMEKLCKLLPQTTEGETKAMFITAISKLIAQNGSCPRNILATITRYAQSKEIDVQQRCIEVLTLLKHSSIMADTLPIDASCEDIEIDEQLSFLNNYVQRALNLGARPYQIPETMLEEQDHSEKRTSLKITPYATPRMPAAPAMMTITPSNTMGGTTTLNPTLNTGNTLNNMKTTPLNIANTQGNQLLGTSKGNQIWGKKLEPPAPTPPPVPTNTNTTTNHVGDNTPTQLNKQVSGNSWGNTTNTNTSSSTNYGPPAPVIPEPPRELTEKEKMAQALFGGMGNSSGGGGGLFGGSSGSNNRRRSSTSNTTSTTTTASSPFTTSTSYANTQQEYQPVSVASISLATVGGGQTVTAPPQQTQQSVNLLDDFMDMNISNNNNNPSLPTNGHHQQLPPQQQHQQPSSSAALSLDQFELGLGHNTAPPPVPTINTNTTSNNNIAAAFHDDLLGLSSPIVPVTHSHTHTPTHATTNTTTTNLISDVFSNLDLSSVPTTTTTMVDNSIKPFMITTPEFGKRWSTMRTERKQTIPVPHWTRLDLEVLRQAIPTTYAHVESIPSTVEAIFAATVTNIGAIVLLHCKLNMNRRCCDIIIKSTAPDVIEREVQHVGGSIANYRG